MTERPILFSAEMVRAILEGRKTQTRRVLRVRGKQPVDIMPMRGENKGRVWITLRERLPNIEDQHGDFIRCWYGVPGDILWVRETFQVVEPWGSIGDEWIGDDIMEIDGRLGNKKPEQLGYWWSVIYKADGDWGIWWRPSIFMPRWASRITLELIGVRVERLCEITGSDACSEGITPTDPGGPIRQFAELWDSINSKRGYGWDVNPWVWVLEFKKL